MTTGGDERTLIWISGDGGTLKREESSSRCSNEVMLRCRSVSSWLAASKIRITSSGSTSAPPGKIKVRCVGRGLLLLAATGGLLNYRIGHDSLFAPNLRFQATHRRI